MAGWTRDNPKQDTWSQSMRSYTGWFFNWFIWDWFRGWTRQTPSLQDWSKS